MSTGERFRKADFEVSVLAEHVWKLDHEVDWEKVSVLDFNTNLHKRLTLEA